MSNLKVYAVEDGATTWVCARHPADALDLVWPCYGYKSRNEYLVEHEVDAREMKPYEELRVRPEFEVRLDDLDKRDAPDGARVEAWIVTTAQQWIDRGKRCVIAGTEF